MDERISNFSQVASIRRYALTEGAGSGLKVIDCDNGNLRFLINESKACDIMQLYHQGQNVSFVSKNGFCAKSEGFIKRFEGGMLYTCGLDSIGARDGYAIHGTIHNLPAEIIRAECNEYGITVESIVRDTELFGKNLVLKRTIFSEIGGDSISIKDTLINEGYSEQNYCILYHVNIGYPFLGDGAKIVADVKSVVPRTEWAKENQNNVFLIQNPVKNMEECCYFLKMNKSEISLTNDGTGKRFTLKYSADTLPCFVEWKSMASGDYALGFEPCTTELDDLFNYKTIKSKEKIDFSLEIKVNKV